MLRVTQIVNWFPTNSETFVLHQIRGLIGKGARVTVCTRLPFEQVPGAQAPFEHPQCDYLHPRPHPRSGLLDYLFSVQQLARECARNPLAWHAHKNPGVGANAREILDWNDRLRRSRPDIIHCQYATLAPYPARLRELHLVSAPLVVSVRGHDITMALRYFGSGMYTKVIRQASVIMPVCDAFRQRLLDMGCPPDRVTVVRSGIDIQGLQYRKRSFPAEGAVRILFVGRLVEKKGVACLIEAFERLIASGLSLKLTIVGDGHLRESLESKVQKSGLSAYIVFFGLKAHEEAIRAIDDSDLLVSPSVTASNGDEEGIPNVLKEAMALGVPVIATRHGGIPELVLDGETGFLVAENDPKLLAETILKAIRMPDDALQRISHSARVKIEREYNIRVLNDRLFEMYYAAIEEAKEISAASSGVSPVGRDDSRGDGR